MIKVLIVEDDTFLGMAYKATFTHTGDIEFQLATDGQEALDILATWKPDVILLDLVMPRMDGFATLAAIKKQDELKTIPVLVASNLGQQEDLDKALGLGAQGFIIKSNTSPDEIVARVREAADTATQGQEQSA